MKNVLTVHSAVGVNVGKVRLNNEDNFYFNGVYLDSENREIPAMYENNCTDSFRFMQSATEWAERKAVRRHPSSLHPCLINTVICSIT